jgi:putative hydrolase of the HAD superfamily
VIRLGGWGVHMPYHVTWEHELENGLGEADAPRILTVEAPSGIPAAIEALAERASS